LLPSGRPAASSGDDAALLDRRLLETSPMWVDTVALPLEPLPLPVIDASHASGRHRCRKKSHPCRLIRIACARSSIDPVCTGTMPLRPPTLPGLDAARVSRSDTDGKKRVA
jgi:hypothetical protein